MLELIGRIHRYKFFDDAGTQVVHPAVKHRESGFGPAFLDNRSFAQVSDLLHYIDLDHASKALFFVLNRVEFLAVNSIDVLDVPKPLIDKPQIFIGERVVNASTTVVPADNHVFDLQYFDGVLKHAQHVEIGMDDLVRDVSVNEQFARGRAGDLLGGNSAIGATDP